MPFSTCTSVSMKNKPELSAKEKAQATLERMTKEEIRNYYKSNHKKKPAEIPRKKITDSIPDSSHGDYKSSDTSKK